MFELGRFITEEMKRQKLKRSEVARRLGYTNINRGLRRLDECIEEAALHNFIVQNLHIAFRVEQSVVQEVLKITKQQILKRRKDLKVETEGRARETFRPHLSIITERSRPTSITMALLTGMADRTVNLPENFAAHSPEKQLEIVQSVVHRHYVDNRGDCLFFGEILGYYYFHHFRENTRLDVEGNVEMDETTPYTPPQGYITIGNKKITGGLFKLQEKGGGKLQLNKSMVVEPKKRSKITKQNGVL